jgi:hypothetical protein
LESHSGFSPVTPSPSKGSRVTSLANKQPKPNIGKEIFIPSTWNIHAKAIIAIASR